MPTPRAAGARLLDAHLAVVMVHLIAEKRFHGVDDAFAAGDGAPEIFTGGIPQHQLRLAAFAVLQIVGVILEGLIGLRGGAEDAGFFGIKQAGDNEITVLFKGRNLIGGNRRHAATMPSGPPTVNRLVKGELSRNFIDCLRVFRCFDRQGETRNENTDTGTSRIKKRPHLLHPH